MNTFFQKIDSFLNKVTMYRLVLWYLVSLVVVASVLNLFGLLGYGYAWSLWLVADSMFLLAVAHLINALFSRFFKVPANSESLYITALIFALTFDPSSPYVVFIPLIVLMIIALGSKFLIARKKKHLFNPVALGMVLMSFVGYSASWWIGGTLWLLPFVCIGGFLIVRKIRRFDLILSFLIGFSISVIGNTVVTHSNFITSLKQAFTLAPVFFFSTVMLTEPLTTPPRRAGRIAYGAFTGFIFAPWVRLGSLVLTPELALIFGNVLSYILSPKKRLVLTLKEIVETGSGTKDFIFTPDEKLDFTPGQFIEWTLNANREDSRGNRRYFTIASSPTENEIHLGVRFYQNPSAFKESLLSLKPGDSIVASQLAGDFVMPNDKSKKMVWIAGGIGVTPFRSMAKYLIDTKQKRDVVLLYASKTLAEVSYKDIFDRAKQEVGLRPQYVMNMEKGINTDSFVYGVIDEALVRQSVPDFAERLFYISGPHMMVVSFKNMLVAMGVSASQIHSDYFPGF